jgi:hypothetical protein
MGAANVDAVSAKENDRRYFGVWLGAGRER